MNIVELKAQAVARQEAATRRRTALSGEIRSTCEQVQAQGRLNFTAQEDTRISALFKQRDAISSELATIESELATIRQAERDEQALYDRHTVRVNGLPRAYDQVARVGNETRTYNPGNDKTGNGFCLDVARAFKGDPVSSERIYRHQQECVVDNQMNTRAVGTGAFVGLTVPQYLTDMYAPAVAALRPFADACNHHDLPPDGMTVNISRITTPSGAAVQATQNTAVQETNMADTLLTENVVTVAGQQTLSRQAIDRGTGIESVVMSDLMRRYATSLDSALLNTATTGLDAVSTTNTFTSASPTADLFYSKVVGSTAAVEAALLGQAIPTLAVMHSRRWYWMTAELTANHPFVANSFAQWNAVMTNNVGYSQGARGQLPNGLHAIVDNNVVTNLGAGTNQDRCYVLADAEAHLWEDPASPMFIRAEQPQAGSLGVLLVVYGYAAWSFRRYTSAVQNIDGTGMIAPVF